MRKRLKERGGALRGRDSASPRARLPRTDVERSAQPLTLYHRPTCPFCVRIFIALARLDAPVERRNITTDAQARQELLAGGGRRQVPCLRIGESAEARWLYESADIVAYLKMHFAADP